MKMKRSLWYLVRVLIFLLIVVLLARAVETYRYLGQAAIMPGLLSDNVCYRGSYEIIVCPYTVPPYETLMLILVVLLTICVWANARRNSAASFKVYNTLKSGV